jgi:hypothetical protein
MDHEQATQLDAATLYVTGDLSPAEAESFEEHFFICPECAEEVRTSAIFAENVRAVFREHSVGLAAPVPEPSPRTDPGWIRRLRAAAVIPVAAAAGFLIVIAYQNLVTIPRLKNEVASLGKIQSPFWLPLKVSRDEESAVSVPKGTAFLMAYFFLPQARQASSYTCVIEGADHVTRQTVPLAVPPPGQPFALLLRAADFPTGRYYFRVKPAAPSAEETTYTIDLNTN